MKKTKIIFLNLEKLARSNFNVLKFLPILLLLFGLEIRAQEVVLSSGGNVTGNGGSLSYSVGQIVYTTNVGTSGFVAQGIQQAFEISVITSIEEVRDLSFSVSIYPNPTTHFLTLQIQNIQEANYDLFQALSYQLYDINGKLLQTETITNNHTKVGLSNLASATYFVKIIRGNQEVKSFRVIKN